MKILAIAWANLVRTSRDRLGLFFIILMPMIIIITLGLTYGGAGTARVGIYDGDRGAFAVELIDAIRSTAGARIEIDSYPTEGELRDVVARGYVQIGLAIPSGYGGALRSGAIATVAFVEAPTTGATAIRSTVERAVSGQSELVRAARFAASLSGVSFDDALADARAANGQARGVAVTVESVASGGSSARNGFATGAQSQLVLFMFLTSLVGAAELVITRQLGISRRMLSTPTGPWTIIAGEGLGRVGLALFQGAFIVVATSVLFGVDWVDLGATLAIVAVFSLVGGGTAMLVGSIVSNPSQGGALGPGLGLVFGLIGGTMVPVDVFPPVMRSLAHLTPHAWAMDAFRAIQLQGAGISGILPELGVLAGFATVLVALAGYRFRRLMASGAI
jgi:ABC-2 type transport system permease protein